MGWSKYSAGETDPIPGSKGGDGQDGQRTPPCGHNSATPDNDKHCREAKMELAH